MVRKPRPRDLIMAANKKIKRLNKVGDISGGRSNYKR